MVQQDMGMFTESASMKAGGRIDKDLSEPFDRPGEWRERRMRHLTGALRLIEEYREYEMKSEDQVKIELQVEVDALKKRIADLQESINAGKKQSFMDTVQNKDLASADADAAFSAPVNPVEDLG